jgi:hypothetical protein
MGDNHNERNNQDLGWLGQLYEQVRMTLQKEALTAGWVATLIGAVLVYRTLRYPLVQAWMSRYVPGAPAAETSRVTVSVLLAALLLIAAAALTARLSRVKTRKRAAAFGAIAGLLAGGLTYALFGAAAAGTAGAQSIFPLLADPPSVPHEGALDEALIACTAWTYGLGWTFWLGGGLLGGLTGLIVGSGAKKVRIPRFFGQLVLAVLTGITSLGLLLNALLWLPLMVGRMDQPGRDIDLAAVFAWNVTMGSHILVLLALLLIAWIWGRRQRSANPAEAWYESRILYTLGGVVVLCTIATIAIATTGRADSFDVGPLVSLFGLGLLLALVLGVLLIALGRGYGTRGRQIKSREMALPGVLTLTVQGLAGGTFLASLLHFLVVAFQLNYDLFIVPAIPYMAEKPATEPFQWTAEVLVRTNYGVHVTTVVRMWNITALGFVALMWLAGGLVWLREQRRSRRKA